MSGAASNPGGPVAPSEPGGSADCLFCRIVAGAEPASIVHADDAVVAFLDAVPVNPGHVLVVPRVHASGLVDLPVDVGAAVWRVAHRIAAFMRSDPAWSEGVNLHLSDGAVADQSVGHVHLHVIPRFKDDGLRIVQDRDPARPSRDELDAVAARLSRDLTKAASSS
ncbi:HIT family protein [Georgenia subflava]|uniref:HIT family protein n=1 Tax=Georgenia subflava TaxID=1622177 RepID=UPI0038601BD9